MVTLQTSPSSLEPPKNDKENLEGCGRAKSTIVMNLPLTLRDSVSEKAAAVATCTYSTSHHGRHLSIVPPKLGATLTSPVRVGMFSASAKGATNLRVHDAIVIAPQQS
jgi:hypothetical protein